MRNIGVMLIKKCIHNNPDKKWKDAMFAIANRKSKSAKYTLYTVVFGRKKDRGHIKNKINKEVQVCEDVEKLLIEKYGLAYLMVRDMY